MKKVIIITISLVLILSLASCKRKNKAKNLEIFSKTNNAYVIRYCSTKLDFGDIYITIENETLTNFYTVINDNYLLDEYYLKINDNSSSIKLESTKEKDKNKTIFNLTSPLNLIKEVDGKEVVNGNSIEIYVKYVDENNIESYIKISTTPKDLIEFIRNKKIK